MNDIVGFPKDDYFYYKSAWKNASDDLVLHILPNTWNGDTGTDPIKARVYTNCEVVELFVNNKSVSNGKQTVKPLEYLSATIQYEPGEIKAVCTDSGGKVAATQTMESITSHKCRDLDSPVEKFKYFQRFLVNISNDGMVMDPESDRLFMSTYTALSTKCQCKKSRMVKSKLRNWVFVWNRSFPTFVHF